MVNLKLEKTIGNGKRMRFKFEGINSHYKAKDMVGKTIYVSTNDDDEINLIGSDLIGFKVLTDLGNKVGILKDVMWLPHSDVYVITNGGKELLIPVIPEVVKGINHEQGVIVITPMEGLLD